MTTKVKITHAGGNKAIRVHGDNIVAGAILLKEGDSFEMYVYDGVNVVVTEDDEFLSPK